MSVVRLPSLLCVQHHQGGAEASISSSSRLAFQKCFRPVPIRMLTAARFQCVAASSDAAAPPVENAATEAEPTNETEESKEDQDTEDAKLTSDALEELTVLRRKKSQDWIKAEKLMNSGRIYEGTVVDSNDGGLLIRFYTLRGFLPFSQLSVARIRRGDKTMKDMAKELVGLTLPVKVIQSDKSKGKLVFSERQALWAKYSSKFKHGAVFDGTVTGIADFGAFVDVLVDGAYAGVGLVYTREISWDIVKNPRDAVKIGQNVRVKVIGFDSKGSKLALSMRQLQPDPLLETLDTLMPKDDSDANGLDEESLATAALPGIDQICEGLQKEAGITAVKLGRQAVEKHVVSQDLELWLSQELGEDGHITLLARAGRQVQEVHVTTSLGREDMKLAIQRVTHKIP